MAGGFRFKKWNAAGVSKKTEALVQRKMLKATLAVKGETQKLLNRSQPKRRLPGGTRIGLDPSKPGEPPKRVENALIDSIATEVVTRGSVIIGRVGSNLKYARAQELGNPKGKLKKRPYLRPALRKSRPAIRAIFRAKGA